MVAQNHPNAPSQSTVERVYVTHAGKWYHREKCYYLAKTNTAITLEQARQQGLRPCKLCRPPDVRNHK
jgi:methylphosphotriester-DNA--protein-cysteine methyltransferase